jgi:hypothetical protein
MEEEESLVVVLGSNLEGLEGGRGHLRERGLLGSVSVDLVAHVAGGEETEEGKRSGVSSAESVEASSVGEGAVAVGGSLGPEVFVVVPARGLTRVGVEVAVSSSEHEVDGVAEGGSTDELRGDLALEVSVVRVRTKSGCGGKRLRQGPINDSIIETTYQEKRGWFARWRPYR